MLLLNVTKVLLSERDTLMSEVVILFRELKKIKKNIQLIIFLYLISNMKVIQLLSS